MSELHGMESTWSYSRQSGLVMAAALALGLSLLMLSIFCNFHLYVQCSHAPSDRYDYPRSTQHRTVGLTTIPK